MGRPCMLDVCYVAEVMCCVQQICRQTKHITGARAVAYTVTTVCNPSIPSTQRPRQRRGGALAGSNMYRTLA